MTRRTKARGVLLLGWLALALLVFGFGAWATFTQISGAIVASGTIEVERNRQIVQHLDGGVVADILVDEGDEVTAGQVLLRLDPTFLLSSLAIAEDQLSEVLARRGRFEAERDNLDAIGYDERLYSLAADDGDVRALMDGQRRLFGARNTSLQQEIEQLGKRRKQISDQINGIDAQMASLTRQLELIEEELAAQITLFDKGLAQANKVLALQREQASLGGRVGELTAARAQSEGRITEIDLEILRRSSLRRENAISELRELQFSEFELTERLRALREQVARLEIRAPVDGIVYGLMVFAQQSVIRAAEPLMFIVPQDRPLVIAARVEPVHIDQVHVGQEVLLRFSAFDQRTTPELYGRVVQISADAFQDDAAMAAYYKAEITLLDGEQAKLPENISLIPGMPVEAFLRTGDRTPLGYLVKPFTDYFTKALRES